MEGRRRGWSEYRNLTFDRSLRTRDAAVRVVGVGHKALDKALAQAAGRPASVASVHDDVLRAPISVFRIRDRITSQSTGVRAIIVGVDHRQEGEPKLLLDWEVLIRLNELPVRKVAMAKPSEPARRSRGGAETGGHRRTIRSGRNATNRAPVSTPRH